MSARVQSFRFWLHVLFVLWLSVTCVSLSSAQGRRKRGEKAATRAPARERRLPAVGTQSEIRGEGKEKVKVMKFSGLDISAQLKSPQLLYFLNRMRAEFQRPSLPHRSFMPELERSTKGKSF